MSAKWIVSECRKEQEGAGGSGRHYCDEVHRADRSVSAAQSKSSQGEAVFQKLKPSCSTSVYFHMSRKEEVKPGK